MCLGKPKSRGRTQGCETRSGRGFGNQGLQKIQCWWLLFIYKKEIYHECPSRSQQCPLNSIKVGHISWNPVFSNFGFYMWLSVFSFPKSLFWTSVFVTWTPKKNPQIIKLGLIAWVWLILHSSLLSWNSWDWEGLWTSCSSSPLLRAGPTSPGFPGPCLIKFWICPVSPQMFPSKYISLYTSYCRLGTNCYFFVRLG